MIKDEVLFKPKESLTEPELLKRRKIIQECYKNIGAEIFEEYRTQKERFVVTSVLSPFIDLFY